MRNQSSAMETGMADRQAGRHGIGAAVPRKEDFRLLTGRGRFTDDIVEPGLCHAVFVRSPHAHARLVAINTEQASAAPGTLAVLTGTDWHADGLASIEHGADWIGPPDVTVRLADGFEVFKSEHVPMPRDTARFAGEAVAVVIAQTHEAAADAAALVEIDFLPLPAVARAVDACAAGAVQLWPACAGNVALDCEVGDPLAVDRAFAVAACTVSLDTWVHRVTGCPMEPRTIIGAYDTDTGRYTLHAGSGRGVDRLRRQLAAILRTSLEQVRVVCGDMGGNFGTRNAFAPEAAILPWASRRLGRPVKWTASRNECFLAEYQGRDLAVDAELALDADGNFLALRAGNVSNVGAYTTYFATLRKGLGIMQGAYAIPAVYVRGRSVVTNTAPTAVYRSAGRPEVIYVIERLIDMAARACGVDRIELRRRNLIPPERFPYTNAVGLTYDNGNYALAMDRALALAGWAGFADRRAHSAARSLKRGIGLANYIEGAGGFPRERAEITITPDGGAELVLGTMNSGQGHETSFAQLVTEWLGIPFDAISFVAHDTDRVHAGGGSHSGRSMRLASLAIREAADQVIANGSAIAAHLLQADASDIAFVSDEFQVMHKGASATIADVARAAATLETLPPELRGSLHGIGDITVRDGAFPYGAHVCEVEVDPDTGVVDIVGWYGVDDVGRAVNPLILHGQAHGAVAQGVGQALMEACCYDRETAQLLSGTFMDYAIPRADTLPRIECELLEIPASSHRFGIRPGGEGGTTPALGALVNAVVDALADFGVDHIEMPLTPERVWRAIQEARIVPTSR